MKKIILILFFVPFLSCSNGNRSTISEFDLNGSNITCITERIELLLFVDGNYSENKILRVNNFIGVIQNKTYYDLNGVAESFDEGGSEGFIMHSLTHKKGYLEFDNKMKKYHIELRKDENIIIDRHKENDTIKRFVIFEKEKLILKKEYYNDLSNNKKIILYQYK